MALVVHRDTRTEDAYRVPSIILNCCLQRQVLTVREALFLTVVHQFFPSSTSLGYTSLANTLLITLVKPLKSEGNLRLADLDGAPPLILQKVESLREKLQKTIDEARGTLTRARVGTAEELETKKAHLLYVKRQALNSYMQNGGLEIKREVDEAVARTRNLWIPLTQTTLKEYWDSIGANPCGGQTHQLFERTFYKTLEKSIQDAVSNFAEWKPPLFYLSYGEALKRTLMDSSDTLDKTWEAKRRTLKDRRRIIEWNYMYLKSRLIFLPCIQHVIKAVLTPLLSSLPPKIQKMADEKAIEIQTELQTLTAFLNSSDCCIDRVEIIRIWGTRALEEDEIEPLLQCNILRRNACLSQIKKLENFDCVTWAKAQWGFSVKDLQKFIKDETDTDRLIHAYTRLAVSYDLDQVTEEDLSLDLSSIPDLNAYFTLRLRKRDEEVLALLAEL